MCLINPVFGADLEIDLPTTVEMAWDHAARRMVLDARVSRARARSRNGSLPEDPQVRVRLKEIGSTLSPMKWTIKLRQDVDELFKLGPERRAALADVAVREAELRILQEEVRVLSVHAFDGVRLALLEEEIVGEELELLTQRLMITRKRMTAGMPVEADVVDAQFDLSDARRRLAFLHQDRVGAEAMFLTLIGADPTENLRLMGPDLYETARAELQGSTIDLQVRRMDAEVQRALLEKKVVIATRIPVVDWVQGSVQLEEGKLPTWAVTTAVRLPVFSLASGAGRLAQSAIDVREAERTRVKRAEDARRERLQARWKAAVNALDEVQSAQKDAQAVLLELSNALSPDELISYEAKLLRMRQRTVSLLDDALSARRALEAPLDRS